MKEGLHPNYQQTTIRCACGNVIETGSTKKDIRVEVCSKCHPFYTGKQKMVDSGGRVSRFNKKFGFDKYDRSKKPCRDFGAAFSIPTPSLFPHFINKMSSYQRAFPVVC